MTDRYPFGADTLLVPFTRKELPAQPRRVAGMSRMRRAGELFRGGVVSTASPQDGRLAEHPDASPFDPNGRPAGHGTFVVLPDGSLPTDAAGNKLYISSPTADLSEVAASGRHAGRMLASEPQDPNSSLTFFMRMGEAVGTGGRFDWQRSGSQIHGLLFGFQHHSNFVGVSNVNVGLWSQQAGLSLDEILTIAGLYARMFSRNADTESRYGLNPNQERLTRIGWNIGSSGIYGAPER